LKHTSAFCQIADCLKSNLLDLGVPRYCYKVRQTYEDSLRTGVFAAGDIPIAELIGYASESEKLGLSTIWIADHYCLRELIVSMTAVAMSTKVLRVAAGAANPFTRHPATYVMSLATLTELAGDRLAFAIGASTRSQSRLFGRDFDNKLALVREYIYVLKKMLEGEEVTYEGRGLNVAKLKLDFEIKPKVPIYLGAIGPKMVELAGELCDGLIITAGASVNFTRLSIERLRRAAIASGRNPDSLSTSVILVTAISNDSRRAKDYVKKWLATFVAQPYFRAIAEVSDVDEEVVAKVRHALTEEGPEGAARLIPEALVDEFAAAGTPDECVKRIKDFTETGVDEIVLMINGPNRIEALRTLTARLEGILE
jgi:5,10-methylenetetrahydromethanopterin reductase